MRGRSWWARGPGSRRSAGFCMTAPRAGIPATTGCSSASGTKRRSSTTATSWTRFARSGVLTRLDTAFSRDRAGKFYVQDRMRENAADLWKWIDDGAYVYVCGDAARMARDVDEALRGIIAQHGGQSPKSAATYLQAMSAERRYVRDVY